MCADSRAADLSVVVIGRNEGERLVRCLESVHAMRWPTDGGPCEIIYVDSDSDDGSPERAEELGARTIVIRPEFPCAALGRNVGWREARSPFVLFLDGDTVLDPDFATRALEAMEDPSVAIVWGHRREIRPQASLYNRVLDLDWVYPPGPSEFCGGDAVMRRSVLEAVEGFDEGLIAGEEPELCQRIRQAGHSILHIDAPMTGHDLAMTRWSQYWRRAVRAGHAYAQVSERLRGSETPLWSRESRRNVVHGAILVALPAAAAVASLASGSWWPVAGACLLLVALVLRTAWKVGWKSGDPTTRLLYAIHSHLQQVPILWGQLTYRGDRARGERRSLIEYKEVAR